MKFSFFSYSVNHICCADIIRGSVVLLLLIGSVFSVATENVNSGNANDRFVSENQWWDKISAKRERKLSRYLAKNREAFKHFKDTPMGSTGIPTIMLRVFPVLFPEIWGNPQEYFAPVGLMKDPFDPDKKLPLGLGHTGSGTIIPVPVGDTTINVEIQATQLSCAACHTGRVSDNRGNIKPLIGAPNNQFDRFRYGVFQTVIHPNYTADSFRTAILAEVAAGAGWLYPELELRQQEALEAAVFLSPGAAENFLNVLRERVIAAAQRSAATIGAYTYGGPSAPDFNGPQHGLVDAYSNAALLVLDPSILSPQELAAAAPPGPAISDIMSIWMQKDRPAGQWDGSVVSPVHRNVESSVAVVGSPTNIDLDNAVITNEFAQNLPAPSYPFSVNKRAAKKGRKLFKAYCASCHYPGSETVFPTEHVGTDPLRANALTDYTLPRLTTVFRASCPENLKECNNAQGKPFDDEEIIRITGGYQALPLDGIWARAPYLHNGSVPTLAALLTGDRPTQFYRGNTGYDQTNVGFTWHRREGQYVMLYDTTLDGFSNAGHDTPEFNGNIDWANEPNKLYYLLEYMKTL